VNPSNSLTIITLPSTTIDQKDFTASWDTNQPSSSQIFYGLPGSLNKNTEILNQITPVTSHTDQVTNLLPCTTYQYSLKSSSGNTVAQSPTYTLTTAGCTGSSSVINQSYTTLDTTTGGVVVLEGTSVSADQTQTQPIGLTVTAPVNYASSSANFQIKQLTSTAVVSAEPLPDNYLLIDNNVYNLEALLSVNFQLETFPQPVTLVFKYSDFNLSGIDESSIVVMSNDGAGWQTLGSCTQDAGARTLTCTTTQFSEFALVGLPLLQNNTSNNSSSSSSNSSSSSSSSGGETGSTSTSSSSTSPDLNGSGRIDVFDLSILLRNWNHSGQGDLNSDGKVDIFDLSILLRSWSR
ncbi:MAG: hypothetical protein M1607_04475, partial [Patescibacteria group bacterium]|nr:hypothetical protein [Patescibacteria group bacterium]